MRTTDPAGRGRPRQRSPQGRARRWVVERTLAWLNRFRKVLVRFEQMRGSHLALLELACALSVFRQTMAMHGYALPMRRMRGSAPGKALSARASGQEGQGEATCHVRCLRSPSRRSGASRFRSSRTPSADRCGLTRIASIAARNADRPWARLRRAPSANPLPSRGTLPAQPESVRPKRLPLRRKNNRSQERPHLNRAAAVSSIRTLTDTPAGSSCGSPTTLSTGKSRKPRQDKACSLTATPVRRSVSLVFRSRELRSGLRPSPGPAVPAPRVPGQGN